MYHLNVDAAVQITGSHNPNEFNGFKFFFVKMNHFMVINSNAKKMILEDDFLMGNGRLNSQDIINDYIEMLASKISIDKKLKVIIDSGNACGCITVPQTMKKIGVDIDEHIVILIHLFQIIILIQQ